MKVPRIAVVLLLWALTPGLTEASVDLTHAIVFGHSFHNAAAEQGHDDSNPEHGCTGAVHLCSCHASPSSVLASELTRHPSPEIRCLLQLDSPHLLAEAPSALEHVPRA